MSMNLIYEHIDEDGEYVACSDFPFQSPTDLTYKVLATNDKAEQIKIMREYLDCKDWGDRYTKIVDKIGRVILNNPRIVLGMI